LEEEARNMKKKVIGIFIVILLMGTAIVPGVIADFKQNNGTIGSINYCSGLGCINETHIITDPKVPYVGQGNDSFCVFASTGMQINYLGFNTTLPEILHDVGSYRLTFWNEHFNVTNDTSGGHAVVIVGYNETNKTICYNDPYAAVLNVSGSYLWEDQEIFKTAVEKMNEVYKIYVFYTQNHTEKPTRKERFEKVHDLNILRLQGEFKYYFGIDIDFSDLPLYLRLFLHTCYGLGIHAAEKQRIHVLGPLQRLRTLSLYKQYETMLLSPYYFYYDVFQQLENVSTYLLEQRNLSPLCLYDGTLLKQESTLWNKLVFYFKEIQDVNMNNSLVKTLMLTNPIFDEIVITLDEIIDIEQQILNNNLKRNIDIHSADKNNIDITGLS